MNTSLKSPCLECDHHLAGGDKNCDQCRDCDKRLIYINAIDPCHSSSVSEHVDLNGDGGSELPDSTPLVKDEQDGSIDNHIKEICKKYGITLNKIRAGIHRHTDPDIKIEFNNARDHIIKELASGKFGDFTQKQIGEYLNISSCTICRRLKLMGIPQQKRKPKPPAKIYPGKNLTNIRMVKNPNPKFQKNILIFTTKFTNWPKKGFEIPKNKPFGFY